MPAPDVAATRREKPNPAFAASASASADNARAVLCRLLSACYYEIGSEFAEEKVFDTMVDAADLLDPSLSEPARRLRDAFSAQNREELLVDYTRLFLGPTEALAPPYGSVWMSCERALMQDSTMAVLRLYNEAGFDVDAAFRDLPDHVAAELEFLYLLIFHENQARRDGDHEGFAAAAKLRRELSERHLGKWAGPFTAAMAEHAESVFYKVLAELTRRFIDFEATRSGTR